MVGVVRAGVVLECDIFTGYRIRIYVDADPRVAVGECVVYCGVSQVVARYDDAVSTVALAGVVLHSDVLHSWIVKPSTYHDAPTPTFAVGAGVVADGDVGHVVKAPHLDAIPVAVQTNVVRESDVVHVSPGH